jgi:CBS domain-containing protein
MTIDLETLLTQTHPYDSLPPEDQALLAGDLAELTLEAGQAVYKVGEPQNALYLILSGQVHITDTTGALVSILGPKNSFGERGLMKDGFAAVTATAAEATTLVAIPAETFRRLVSDHPSIKRFFDRSRPAQTRKQDLMTLVIADVMTRNPITCAPSTSLMSAAQKMRDRKVSCLVIYDDGVLSGILTTKDLTNRVLAEGLSYDTPLGDVMTANPLTLPPTALVSDVLMAMTERRISHMPVVDGGKLVGILSQTDLTRLQATSSASLISEIAVAPDSATIAKIVARIPDFLVQLVGAHNAHQVVTRLITDIGDAATRRLLSLAEETLGPPPVPYLWLACGSQGRQEQTGVSDQDNCLILDDAATEADDAYFAALAKFVSDGLDEAGYFYCPGDMMATNPKWRQPLKVWRRYFSGWIHKPDPEAQMLASVMYDLRPIGGEESLFAGLQEETLALSSKNSIFVAHMISNSLKHTPPLGLFRGFATVRSGEHKNTIDLKHNGVVPVVDLGRIYALQGELTQANTRARLVAAVEAGIISSTGGRDLIDAYDMIADTRLAHQAAQIKHGEKPDNFMSPSDLSDFERSHLRDAFVVIKTMQSAAGSRGGPLS